MGRKKKETNQMKLSQILKIAGGVVGGLAGLVLIFKLLNDLLTHPVLDLLVIVGALAYFAGTYYKKQGK